MKTTDYTISRFDRGLRTKQTHRKDITAAFASSIRSAGYIIGTCLLALLVWNTSVLSETIQREATLVERLEETWLSCLNNGAVYIGGELHICKAVNTGLGKKHLEDKE